jgi:hypothetical protein
VKGLREEETIEEKGRKIVGGEKRKWGNRGLNRVIFGQNGRER